MRPEACLGRSNIVLTFHYHYFLKFIFSHIGAVERNAAMCVEEGALLASILDKSVVDYDIDDYGNIL